MPHQYILLGSKPKVGANSDASLLIANYLFQRHWTKNQWCREKRLFPINWSYDRDQPQRTSRPINYLEISNYIRRNGRFSNADYNLPELKCFWLDFTIDTKINWHRFDETGPNGLTIHDGTPQQQYGASYPIKPKLNREGHSYTTLQPQLLHRIVSQRNKLIQNSADALTDEWFFDLRTLISDTISIVEITLNQFYIKAEYDPLPGWRFDKAKVGDKNGRRFEDKLGWVYKITGKHLGAEAYVPACNNLRELRNHMMHFDPPSLIVTIEEATTWLNQIIDIGYLLIRIRRAIGAEVSLQLVNFILQKEAVFNPEPAFAARLPIGTGQADYASSTWARS